MTNERSIEMVDELIAELKDLLCRFEERLAEREDQEPDA